MSKKFIGAFIRYSLALCALTCATGTSALDISHERYTIYYGDINGDGWSDIYFHSSEEIVLLHDDIIIPIVIPPLPSFVIYQTRTGYELPVAYSMADLSALTIAEEQQDYYLGDFNGNGHTDILLRGHDSMDFSVIVESGADDSLPSHLAFYSPYDKPHNLSNRDTRIEVRDLNQDGKTDFIVSDANGANDAIYWGSSTGTPSESDLRGSTAGEFRVAESGAATYSVPIFAPPGTAGVTPQLSLNYSSQGSNGPLGQGWSIGGLSTISRCRQTLAQDGQANAITWTSEDRFCLDGQRLILASGIYGSPNSTYKTEIDSFITVKAIGGSAGHPDYFTVERKDGSLSHYGSNASARLETFDNKVLSWAQNRFADSVGNKIDYFYQSAGGHRISLVRYAFGADTLGQAEIRFIYDATARPDPQRGYVAGYGFDSSKRLSSIVVYNEGQEVRHYRLTYTAVSGGAAANKTSRLDSISECVDDKCLTPLTFSWSLDQRGFESSGTTLALSTQKDRTAVKYLPADINGDGIQDIVWQEPDWDDDDRIHDQYWMYVLGNSSGGFGAPTLFYSNSGNVHDPYSWQVIDYNADGRADVAIHFSGRWNIFLSQPQANGSWKLSETSLSTPLTDPKAMFADVNSDGLVDAVSLDGIRYLERVSSDASASAYGFGSVVDMSWPENPVLSLPPGEQGNAWWGIETNAGLGDFDGDGKTDLVFYVFFQDDCNFLHCTGEIRYYAVTASNGQWKNLAQIARITDAKYESVYRTNNPRHFSHKVVVNDLNRDSLTDAIVAKSGTKYINTGKGFFNVQESGVLGSVYGDYNRDGYLDNFHHDTSAKRVTVRIWNPSGNNFGSPINVANTNGSSKEFFQFLDVTGDGVEDYLHFAEDNLSIYKGLGNGQPANTVTAFPTGQGGRTFIDYGPLGTSGHYSRITVGTNTSTHTFNWKGKDYTYTTSEADIAGFYSALNGSWDLPLDAQTLGRHKPVLELMAPMYVVTSVESTAPAARYAPGNVNLDSRSKISYFYGEGKIQASGRGMLGFHKIMTVDEQTHVSTTTTYRQDFPFIGYPQETEVRSVSGHLLSKATNTWALMGWQSTWPETAKNQGTRALGPLQPFLRRSEEQTYGLRDNGASQGNLLKTVTTSNRYDYYGNPTQITVQTKHGNVAVVETKTTNNTYGSTIWHKRNGRLTRTEVTTTRGDQSKTRTSAFTYYTAGAKTGLLLTEVIEPDKPEYKLTTLYEYDDFGNKIKITQAGEGLSTRYTRSVYDASGRYIDSSYNSLGIKTEEVIERNELGAPTVVKGLNGQETYFFYDLLGREVYRSDKSGAWVQTEYHACWETTCPKGGSMRVLETLSGGGWSAKYLDILNRVIRETAVHYNGGEVQVDTEYDNLGRVKRKSEPHSGTAQYWTEFRYDILGRVVETKLPGISTPIYTSFNGYLTTTTYPNQTTKIEIKNAVGELANVRDPAGQVIYTYDVHGNLIRTTNSDFSGDSENVVVEMSYDDLGRKIAMKDPDKGEWTYRYNVFGELISQTDAKGQTSTITYDRLGRMETRIDRRADNSIESNVTWTYDTARNGVGELDNVQDSVSGYMRAYTYDYLGRRSTTETYLPGNLGNHFERMTYDSIGRVDLVFDAAGDGTWSSHAIRNTYNDYGYLNAVWDAFDNTLYYLIQRMDLRGNVIKSYNGNGVTRESGYDPATGRLLTLRAGVTAALGDVQDLAYTWDELGNLTQRKDQSGSKNLTEDFTYDAVNRLKSAAVVGRSAQNVEYNGLGNITYKTGVGYYRYEGPAGPHAVSSTSNGADYYYDANGNLIRDTEVDNFGGRSLKYTTFDKPYEITKDGHKTEFQYGPDRSRYVRIDTVANNRVTTTRYIGNVEKITKPDGTQQVKRYLPGGVLITIDLDRHNNQTASTTQYLYKDHLGSLDVVTDAVGAIEQEFSFDAWGQRRNAINWNALSVSSLLNFDHSITNRGFTGHEMLDEVGLIHMNGRVYDPRLGRFLQADTIIQFPDNTQSYNRYSYVLNNPVKYTDPSGHFIPLVVGVIAKVVFAASAVQVGIAVGVAAFAQALTQGANFGQALFSGIISGVAAGAFSAMGGVNFAETAFGQVLGGTVTEVLAYGAVGGITSVLQGGKFGHGFVTAGLSAPLGGGLARMLGGGATATFISRVVVGGTLSDATGGKFANGAATAAFAAVVNSLAEVPTPENSGNQSSIDRVNNLPDSMEERQAIYNEGLEAAKAQELNVDETKITPKLDEIKLGKNLGNGKYSYHSFTSKSDAIGFLKGNPDWFVADGVYYGGGNISIYATAVSAGTRLSVGSMMTSYVHSGNYFSYNLTGVENVIQTIAHETGHYNGYSHGNDMYNREFRAIKRYRGGY